MKNILRIVVLSLALSGSANATTLLNETGISPQAGTHYDFSLVASSASTTLIFAGYEVGNNIYANGITFTDSAVNNLLSTWTYTAAGSDSYSGQNGDGSSITFYDASAQGYDTFTQTIATQMGATYTLDFDFSSYGNADSPSAFQVTTSASPSGVPEPTTWMMLVGGFGLIGAAMRRSRKAAFA